MALTDINSEDRLVQQTFADHLRDKLGWDSAYAYNTETFGPSGTLGRANEREVVLLRDLRAALARLNPDLPESAREQAIEKLTRTDFARSLVAFTTTYGSKARVARARMQHKGGVELGYSLRTLFEASADLSQLLPARLISDSPGDAY